MPPATKIYQSVLAEKCIDKHYWHSINHQYIMQVEISSTTQFVLLNLLSFVPFTEAVANNTMIYRLNGSIIC
jgi:hypothetical protein